MMTEIAQTVGKAGILLFTLGLLIGFVLAKLRNPRLGLSAHLTAVQTGAMLVAVSLFWQYLGMPENWAVLIAWSIIGSSYVLTAGILISGALGASRALPIAGAGHSASKLRENLVSAMIYSSSSIMALAWVAICWFIFV